MCTDYPGVLEIRCADRRWLLFFFGFVVAVVARFDATRWELAEVGRQRDAVDAENVRTMAAAPASGFGGVAAPKR